MASQPWVNAIEAEAIFAIPLFFDCSGRFLREKQWLFPVYKPPSDKGGEGE